MRLLGVLGGMSWASTAHYYRALNEGVAERLGGLHSARVIIHSVDFAPIARAQHDGEWATTSRTLGEAGAGLARAGARALLLATNTMHKVAGEVEAASGIPLIHIADATASAILAAGHRRVGLLATAFTMEEDFYIGRLREHGLDVVVPDAADRVTVHRIIYDELCHGLVREESRAAYREIGERLADTGAEAIILGCTEIGMLLSDGDLSVPCFDTTELHAAAGVDFLLG